MSDYCLFFCVYFLVICCLWLCGLSQISSGCSIYDVHDALEHEGWRYYCYGVCVLMNFSSEKKEGGVTHVPRLHTC